MLVLVSSLHSFGETFNDFYYFSVILKIYTKHYTLDICYGCSPRPAGFCFVSSVSWTEISSQHCPVILRVTLLVAWENFTCLMVFFLLKNKGSRPPFVELEASRDWRGQGCAAGSERPSTMGQSWSVPSGLDRSLLCGLWAQHVLWTCQDVPVAPHASRVPECVFLDWPLWRN